MWFTLIIKSVLSAENRTVLQLTSDTLMVCEPNLRHSRRLSIDYEHT